MIDKFLKTKSWSTKITNNFLEALKDYSDDDKCRIIFEVTKTVMNHGNGINLKCAETVLIYATQHFFDVQDNNSKALIYYRLGELYELHLEDYVKAYTNYKKYELNNTQFDGVHSILLRILLLRDNFSYSEEMEKELNLSYGEIDLGLRQDRVYENIGTLIVAQKEENDELCEKLIKRIKAIVKADELFFLDLIFRKDTVTDSLKPPQRLLDYVNKL